MKRLFTTAIYILCVILTTSGNTNEKTLTMMFKQLSISEGLSNNSVRSIFRDSRGFLWIGTESGLNKYDGYSFHQYYQSNSGLSDDAILKFLKGRKATYGLKQPTNTAFMTIKQGKSATITSPYLKRNIYKAKTFKE